MKTIAVITTMLALRSVSADAAELVRTESGVTIKLFCSERSEVYKITTRSYRQWDMFLQRWQFDLPPVDLATIDCREYPPPFILDVPIPSGQDGKAIYTVTVQWEGQKSMTTFEPVTYVPTPERPWTNCETLPFEWQYKLWGRPTKATQQVGRHDWIRMDTIMKKSKQHVLLRVFAPTILASTDLWIAHTADPENEYIPKWNKTRVHLEKGSAAILRDDARGVERSILLPEKLSRKILLAPVYKVIFGYRADDGPYQGQLIPLSAAAICTPGQPEP